MKFFQTSFFISTLLLCVGQAALSEPKYTFGNMVYDILALMLKRRYLIETENNVKNPCKTENEHNSNFIDLWNETNLSSSLMNNSCDSPCEGYRIFKEIAYNLLLKFELSFILNYDPDNVFEWFQAKTLGALPVYKRCSVNPDNRYSFLSHELRYLLTLYCPPDIVRSLLKKREDCSSLIKTEIRKMPPLNQLYLKVAFKNWFKYAGHVNYLQYINRNPFINSLPNIEKLNTIDDFISSRLLFLDDLMTKIFILDHKLSGIYIYTACILVQYLRYISRFSMDTELRHRICRCILNFHAELINFAFEVKSSIKIVSSFTLSNDKRRCEYMISHLLEAHFVSMPTIDKSMPFDYFKCVERTSEGFKFQSDETFESDIFIFVSNLNDLSANELTRLQERYTTKLCKPY